MTTTTRRPSLLWRRHAGRAQHGRESGDFCQHHLEALAEELRVLGVNSELIMSGSRPRLQLGRRYGRSNADSGFEDHVLAALVPGAGWSYWWPTIDVISEAGDPAGAARIIADQLILGDLDAGAPLPDWRF